MGADPRVASELRSDWSQRLLDWYRRRRRVLPWRDHPDPYAVWVSEIMLQQTQVTTVQPYFEHFLKRFPNLETLAAADLQEVLLAWQGLGYYARARHLHQAARKLADANGGGIPRTSAEWSRLPGVGPYTAAAVASICFGEPCPVVDGNVARIFARLLACREDIRTVRYRRRVSALLRTAITSADSPGDFNQALMELGALVCRPAAPRCPDCPLQADCQAFRSDRADAFPVSRKQPRKPVRYAVAVVAVRRGRILVRRRVERGLLGGLWELPTVEIQPTAQNTADPPDATRQALERETGLQLPNLELLGKLKHVFTHFSLELTTFICRSPRGRAQTPPSGAMKWLHPGQLSSVPLSTLQRRALIPFLNVAGRERPAQIAPGSNTVHGIC